MSELDEIRKITNNDPAPAPKAAPPMRCPACGAELKGGQCTNDACDGG